MGYSLYRDGRVFYESWKDGRREVRRQITGRELEELGILERFTIEQKREAISRLNYEAKRETKKHRELANHAKSAEFKSIYLPEIVVESWWRDVGKLAGYRAPHWNRVKSLITHLDAPPHTWYTLAERIYSWAAERAYSPFYARKLIAVLNSYGKYFCRATREPWEPVPPPRGMWSGRIRRAFYRKTGGHGLASLKLTFKMVREAKSRLKESDYAWLMLSVAFGLRPEEIKRGHLVPGRKELRVYQPKKERLGFPEPKCWKRIPIKLMVQREALGMVEKLDGTRPGRKTMMREFGPRVTLYGGRKFFAYYMRKVMKYDPILISRWMGHESYDTTREFYDIDPDFETG